MDLLYRNILLKSDVEDIEQICKTEKHAYTICRNDALWKQIYEKEGIPFPTYPNKLEFYLNDLKEKKYHLKEARRWVDYLNALGDVADHCDYEMLYVRVYDIKSFSGEEFINVFDEILDDDMSEVYESFYSEAINSQSDSYYVELGKEGSVFVVSFYFPEEDDEEPFGKYQVDAWEMTNLISKLLQLHFQFYNPSKKPICLPDQN